MNALVLLTIVLFVCMVLVGGSKGLRSFIALFFNFGILLITIIFMTSPNINPFLLTVIASLLIGCVSMFYINGIHLKTKLAFLSTMVTVVILLGVIMVATKGANIQGFSEESADDIAVYSLRLGVDFVKIGAAVIMMSTIGAIIDVAVSITSPMQEIFNQNEQIERKNLFGVGMRIGRDILGSMTNTLFFAFIGGYLSLIIWFKDLSYTTGQIVNSKVFSAEVITILCAGMGVGLSIPITSWITAYFLVKSREKKRTKS